MSAPDDVVPATGVLGRALAAVGVAVLVAGVVGLVGWGLTRAVVDDGGKDAWGDLAAVAVGVVLGVGAGVVAWAVGLATAARRSFPRGRRLGVVLLTMGVTVGGFLVVAVVLTAVGPTGSALSAANAVAFLVVAVLACGVFPWWARRPAR